MNEVRIEVLIFLGGFIALGVVVLLLALARKIVTKWFSIEFGKVARVFAGALGLVIVGASASGLIYEGYYETPCPSVSIARPSQNESAPRKFNVSGSSSRIADRKSAWLVVHPVGEVRRWPQGAVVPAPSDGKWLQGAHLGGEKGQRFEIEVVCTSPNAHREFVKCLEAGCSFLALPQGARLVATVEVTLTD